MLTLSSIAPKMHPFCSEECLGWCGLTLSSANHNFGFMHVELWADRFLCSTHIEVGQPFVYSTFLYLPNIVKWFLRMLFWICERKKLHPLCTNITANNSPRITPPTFISNQGTRDSHAWPISTFNFCTPYQTFYTLFIHIYPLKLWNGRTLTIIYDEWFHHKKD